MSRRLGSSRIRHATRRTILDSARLREMPTGRTDVVAAAPTPDQSSQGIECVGRAACEAPRRSRPSTCPDAPRALDPCNERAETVRHRDRPRGPRERRRPANKVFDGRRQPWSSRFPCVRRRKRTHSGPAHYRNRFIRALLIQRWRILTGCDKISDAVMTRIAEIGASHDSAGGGPANYDLRSHARHGTDRYW
jgi:hypothetical protein